MRLLRPFLVVSVLAGSAVLGLLTAGVGSVQAATPARYVALGDSYSAGVGAGGTTSGGSCARSTNAYPQLWAAAHTPAAFTFAACSGATTSTVQSGQLTALTEATTLVSITVGGNDVGFSSIMTTCALHGTSDCVSAVQAGENTASSVLPGRLDNLFSAIRGQSPSAKVVVLDYPAFYQLGVWYCVGLSGTSRAKLDEGINQLDGLLQAAAARHGFVFADVRSSFVGHQLCSGDKWLHALNFGDITESYHPTAAGQAQGYLSVFSAA